MTTHQFVYQTFIIYICLKAAILLPLAWFTYLVRRAEKQGLSIFGAAATTDSALAREAANSDQLPSDRANVQTAA